MSLDWNTVPSAIIFSLVTLFIGLYSFHLIKRRYEMNKRQHHANVCIQFQCARLPRNQGSFIFLSNNFGPK
jgi:hypothetical protein